MEAWKSSCLTGLLEERSDAAGWAGRFCRRLMWLNNWDVQQTVSTVTVLKIPGILTCNLLILLSLIVFNNNCIRDTMDF